MPIILNELVFTATIAQAAAAEGPAAPRPRLGRSPQPAGAPAAGSGELEALIQLCVDEVLRARAGEGALDGRRPAG